MVFSNLNFFMITSKTNEKLFINCYFVFRKCFVYIFCLHFRLSTKLDKRQIQIKTNRKYTLTDCLQTFN